MPTTKGNITIFDGTTGASLLTGTDTAGGPVTKSGPVDLSAAYGGIWQIIVTNDAAKQAKGIEVQAEVGPTQADGDFVPFDCRRIAAQEAGVATPFAIRVPHEPRFSRIVVNHGNEDGAIKAIFTRVDQV